VYAALLHRLDRPTGGVLALAKTSKAAARISKEFQARKVQKTYYAITERAPDQPSGTLEHHMRRLNGKNIMRAYDKKVHASKPARLYYKVLKEKGGRPLIEVKPETGRKHQIRVQLASMRCTIVGDVKYGKTSFNPDKSICLLAGKLSFEHPTTKESVEFVAPWPETSPWLDFRLQ
jgi:23S rRNA pseudouridine1911/1915/1917 synthase